MKIALFTTRPSFFTHCSIWSLLHMLSTHVECIDIFSERYTLNEVALRGNVFCHYLDEEHTAYDSHTGENGINFFQKFRSYLKGYKVTSVIHDALRDYVQNRIIDHMIIRECRYDQRRLFSSHDFLRLIDKKCINHPYNIAIGLGHQGLILAHKSLPEVPLVYFSDEIYYRGHPWFKGPKFLMEKEMEKQAFLHVNLVIIQDEDRARLLFYDNGMAYQPDKVTFFPVSLPGKPKIWRSDFFIRRFPGLKNKKILLQHGSLIPERCTGELFRVSRNCPEPYAMVFHGGLSPYLKAEYRRARCLLSEPNIPLAKLEEVAAGAHIGLVFYTDKNKNDSLIAHASGQLALFLKCGVPVIASNTGSLVSLVQKWRCGIVVSREEDIFRAADKICANYEEICRQSIACFNAEFRLEPYYQNLITRLNNIAKQEKGKF